VAFSGLQTANREGLTMLSDRELLAAVRAEGPHSKAVEELIRRFEDDVAAEDEEPAEWERLPRS
jgi:hypothetical protein